MRGICCIFHPSVFFWRWVLFFYFGPSTPFHMLILSQPTPWVKGSTPTYSQLIPSQKPSSDTPLLSLLSMNHLSHPKLLPKNQTHCYPYPPPKPRRPQLGCPPSPFKMTPDPLLKHLQSHLHPQIQTRMFRRLPIFGLFFSFSLFSQVIKCDTNGGGVHRSSPS